ncbi:hypothetical protein WAI453_007876 [Rhynchosporium graminicola]
MSSIGNLQAMSSAVVDINAKDANASNTIHWAVVRQALHGTRTFIQIAHYHSIYDEVIQPPIKKSKEKLRKSGLNVEADRAFSFAGNPQINRLIAGVDTSHCLVIVTSAKSAWKSIFTTSVMDRRTIYNKDHTFSITGPEFDVIVEVEKESTEEGEDTDDSGNEEEKKSSDTKSNIIEYFMQSVFEKESNPGDPHGHIFERRKRAREHFSSQGPQ